ncbi:hypothetical protein T484DRAFT_1912181, partial [Baffinella frigidus]
EPSGVVVLLGTGREAVWVRKVVVVWGEAAPGVSIKVSVLLKREQEDDPLLLAPSSWPDPQWVEVGRIGLRGHEQADSTNKGESDVRSPGVGGIQSSSGVRSSGVGSSSGVRGGGHEPAGGEG